MVFVEKFLELFVFSEFEQHLWLEIIKIERKVKVLSLRACVAIPTALTNGSNHSLIFVTKCIIFD